MSSSVETEYVQIVTLWRANCPVAAARRCFTDLGGPTFDRPQIPSPASITTSNRETKLAGAVWIRLQIDGIAGSAYQMGIDPACKTRRIGSVTQHLYYPLGYGLDFVLPLVDSARAIFHRESLSSGLIQFRDAEAPLMVEIPADTSAGWGRFDLENTYWVSEAI